MLNVGTVLVGQDPIHIGSFGRIINMYKDKYEIIWTINEKVPFPPVTYRQFTVMEWIEDGKFYIQSTKKLEEYM